MYSRSIFYSVSHSIDSVYISYHLCASGHKIADTWAEYLLCAQMITNIYTVNAMRDAVENWTTVHKFMRIKDYLKKYSLSEEKGEVAHTNILTLSHAHTLKHFHLVFKELKNTTLMCCCISFNRIYNSSEPLKIFCSGTSLFRDYKLSQLSMHHL